MVNSKPSCPEVPTNGPSRWPHQQYYIGDKDEEERKNGIGENHWSGAESLEWYTGQFYRDTMHGEGEYRWRFRGPENSFITFEGHFYGNCMHGYGAMSYPDGRIFNGIFYKNVRWGPGVESHVSHQEDVGLWRGSQLVRLAWRPETPTITIDLITGPTANACVEPFRNILTTRVRQLGQVNSAIELLKQIGADPVLATEKWSKLYSKHCNDFASPACHVEMFDYEYYKSDMYTLEEVAAMPQNFKDSTSIALESIDSSANKTFYAWNNTWMIKEMMKHCFKHETQRESAELDLRSIIAGPRNNFKLPAGHELNSRSLLMASFLGYITNVAQLVNDCNVHPDVADIQGNTALMYATCGDQAEVVHFLAEAGANVNSYNDSCCTPLAASLIKYACTVKDIPISGQVQSLVPPLTAVPPAVDVENKPFEWHITRNSSLPTATAGLLPRPGVKSLGSRSINYSKTLTSKLDAVEIEVADTVEIEAFIEEKQLFKSINTDFTTRVSEMYSFLSYDTNYYLFQVQDMVKCFDENQDDQKKPIPEIDSKKTASKIMKGVRKPSKDLLWQHSERDNVSMSSVERIKKDALNRNMKTIEQLLDDGADPRLVRFPQPALVIATISGSSDLVRHLTQHGADVNEIYPQIFYYRPIDLAVSLPLSHDNLDLIKTLLESGASIDHTLKFVAPDSIPNTPGPTLLHAALVKKVDSVLEEEIQCYLLKLLLEYGCDSLKQFNGYSALDKAMSTSNMTLLEVFIKCPKTDLNAIINDSKQTVLLKLFSNPFCNSIPIAQRLQTLSNLLLYGADPFIKCQNKEEIYANIFVFTKKTLEFFDFSATKSMKLIDKADSKPKKDQKESKHDKLTSSDNKGDYRQAINLVTGCARMLYIRWLQGKLLRELIKVVEKYEHRHWNMIFPEHKQKKAVGLWLSCTRSLEIWEILRSRNKKKHFKDRRILKHVLCIVQFYSRRVKTSFKWPVKVEEKNMIENDVNCLIREHKIAKALIEADDIKLTRPYVMPELYEGSEEKFQVCFECSLPLDEHKIPCSSCNMVSFCSLDCIRLNIGDVGCHPCRDYLKMKYFACSDDKSIVTN